MPVIVGQQAPVTTTVPVVGVDGVLTVQSDPAPRPAAFVTVDFSALASPPAGIAFVTVLRDGVTVRGLDRVAALSGVTAGYASEGSPGAPWTFVAQAYSHDGALLATSTPVSVTVVRPRRTWLLPLRAPVTGRSFVVETWPTWTYPRPGASASPLGSRWSAYDFDVRKAGAGSMSVHTETAAEEQALLAALSDDDAVYWLVPDVDSVAAGQVDRYVTIGDVAPAPEGPHPWRTWSWSGVQQVDRPPTTDWVVLPPGRTFADVDPALQASAVTVPFVSWVPGAP